LTATADRRTPPAPVDDDAESPAPDEDFSPEASLHRTVQEGRRRLDRSPLAMAVTGVVGGLDIGTGILAMLVAAVAIGVLLAGAQLFHSILDSLLMFAALHTASAPFGYLDWLSAFGWSAMGNMVGGLLLVTMLRLLQVPRHVADKRASPNL